MHQLGYAYSQLFNKTLIYMLLGLYFIDVINLYDQLTLSKGDNLQWSRWAWFNPLIGRKALLKKKFYLWEWRAALAHAWEFMPAVPDSLPYGCGACLASPNNCVSQFFAINKEIRPIFPVSVMEAWLIHRLWKFSPKIFKS